MDKNKQTLSKEDEVAKINKIVDSDFNDRKFQVYWTWYLFFIANILIVVGVSISFVLFKKAEDINVKWWMPIIICNVLSLVVFTIFMYYESKSIIPLKYHINHKWYKFLIASIICYGLSIAFVALYPIFCAPATFALVLTLLILSMLWIVVTIAIYRYARFHIDQDIYRRRHGIEVKEKLEKDKKRKSERDVVDQASDVEFKKMRDNINDSNPNDLIGKEASSGLLGKLEKDEK